jgi:hypothetical protein
VNVDRHWLGTSGVLGRVLVAGLLLLGAGYALLGWGSRSRHIAANAAAQLPASGSSTIESSTVENSTIDAPVATGASPLAEAMGLRGEGHDDSDLNVRVRSQARALFAGLPLMFEPNRGQGNLDASDRRAQFVSRGSGYSLFLGSEGAILSLVSVDSPKHDSPKHDSPKPDSLESSKAVASHALARVQTVQMKLAGANPNAILTATDRLPGKSNYLIGNDPAKWRRDLPQFGRVRYKNIYPGIDLIFYGNQGRLEYDFQVAPGSDPAQAELQFNGAKKLELKD